MAERSAAEMYVDLQNEIVVRHSQLLIHGHVQTMLIYDLLRVLHGPRWGRQRKIDAIAEELSSNQDKILAIHAEILPIQEALREAPPFTLPIPSPADV